MIRNIIEFLNKPKNNVIFIGLFTLISWSIAMSADLSKVGLGGIANLVFPIILGLGTLVAYYVSRLFLNFF